jgi:hypothetical protein
VNCYLFIEAEKAQRRNVKRACEAGPDRQRHAGLAGRFLRTRAPPYSRPVPHPVLAPGHRRPARRRHLPPIQLNLPLPLPHRHEPHLHRRCCDDPINPSTTPRPPTPPSPTTARSPCR